MGFDLDQCIAQLLRKQLLHETLIREICEKTKEVLMRESNVVLSDAINSVAEMYVAPRSLTLDLKTLLSGREKMDTDAVGVLIVTIKRAHGFQNGDKVKFWQKQGDQKGDLYVTLSWSKWGKPLWSTRCVMFL